LEKFEMKKTLVALAVMAVAGAASAQIAPNSVTLYGLIDTAVVFRDVGGVSTTTMDAGTMNGSRWGMKGTEDLGGGMNAVFQLEGGIDSSTQQLGQSTAGANPRIFGRQGYVGLSGGFGTLTLGRQYTPADVALGIDAAGAQGFGGGAMYAVFASNYAQADSLAVGRQDNSINYSLPAMSGVTGNIMMGLDESSTTILQPQKLVGFNIGYAGGPLGLQFASETITATNAATSSTGWLAGVNYNLGAAKVSVIFTGGTSAANQVDAGWALGTGIPMGPTLIQLSYARETSRANGATADIVTSAFGGNVGYQLSKRTDVYASYLNKEDVSAANVSVKGTYLATGVRHRF